MEHRVDRVNFDVTYADTSAAGVGEQAVVHAVQAQVNERWYSDLAAQLDCALTSFAPADGHFQVDCLTLDLGRLSLQNWHVDLGQRFAQALADALAATMLQRQAPDSVYPSLHSTETVKFLTPVERDWQAASHFLLHGQLPWWHPACSVSDLSRLLQGAIAQHEAAGPWLREHLSQSVVRRRIALQGSADLLMAVINVLVPSAISPSLQLLVQAGIASTSAADIAQASHAVLTALHELLPRLDEKDLFLLVLQTLFDTNEISFSEVKLQPILAGVPSSWRRAALQKIRERGGQAGISEEPNTTENHQPLASNRKDASIQHVHATAGGRSLLDLYQAKTTKEEGASAELSIDTRREVTGFFQEGSVYSHVQGHQDGLSVLPPGAHEGTSAMDTSTTAWTVGNAGLVLVHPFLDHFFVQCGFKSNWFPFAKRLRAALLLQHLVCDETCFPESAMTLNKVLCGLAVSEPLPVHLEPTKHEVEQCRELLTAVITHWQALQNSSPAALRTGFLQRPGLLSVCDSGWLLRVEGRSHDVLLQRLPWGLSLVRYSWMDRPLTIDWSDSP